VREAEIELKGSGSSADLQAASRTIAHVMGEPIGRVVVIEDEQPVRDAVLAALRAERFTGAGFEDLPSTGDVLAFAPDLAILDVLLESGNGFELARLLRQQRELPIFSHCA
jgi:CheY-like chemotaxis protein